MSCNEPLTIPYTHERIFTTTQLEIGKKSQLKVLETEQTEHEISNVYDLIRAII